METYNSFNELAAANMKDEFPNVHFLATDNMTRVSPKVSVSDGQLQAKLDNTFVGARQREYEAPHVTVEQRVGDKPKARLLLSTCQLMESTTVDPDIIKAIQMDMRNNPEKYIKNWNENNPHKQLPLPQQKNEQSKKDEMWKEAAWYKEQQTFTAEEKNTRQD